MNSSVRLAAAVLAAATVATSMTACFPLVLGGAVAGGAVVYTDRRTSGTQLDDESIELKSVNRLSEALGARGRVSVTSYNRLVLITGSVATAADRNLAEQTVSKIENVRSIVNELRVSNPLPETTHGSDLVLTGKIKASLIDSKDIFAQSVKVVSEGGTVYLMGRVTEREASRAADVARSVSGVNKVVRVFEILTEAELASLQAAPAPAAASAPR